MTEIAVPDEGGDTLTFMELDGGYRVPLFGQTPDTIRAVWETLPDFKFREDDVLLCAFPKSGTNWLFEVLSMIVQKKAERVDLIKSATHMEADLQESIEGVPSPRVLNTHVHFRFLPKDIKGKGVKTVLVMRNPKDTAVSYYNHYRSLRYYQYSGKWENWLPTYISGAFSFGTYESYLLEWEKAIQEGPGFPLHVMYYEDIKENGIQEVHRLAEFLGIDMDDEMTAAIENQCQFKNMKDKYSDDVKKELLTENREFFRKGEIGDWKNWFTVAQNEMFDKVWDERMKTSSLKFQYVPSVDSV